MKKNLFLICLVHCIILAAFSSLIGAAEEPAVKKSSEKKSLFCIQVEAIASREQALALEKKFIHKGYPAYLDESPDSSGKTVYQVRIGNYASRSKAETAARKFYRKEKKPYWITPVQSEEIATAVSTAKKADHAETAEMEQEEAEAAPEEAAEKKAPDPGSPDGGGKQDANAWPATTTKIYTYRGPQGSLRMTNNLERIPRELQNSVESISIFPVKFIAFNKKKKVLTLEVEKNEQDVKLLGVALSSAAIVQQVSYYCEKNVTAVPLRLKYAPPRNEKNDAPLAGTILLKQGTPVNLEIVRLGLAPCATENVPAQFKQDCLEAEAAARSSKAGIWAANAQQ